MRVKRPAMKKKRRRRVLVVASASPGLISPAGQVMGDDPVSSTGQALGGQPGPPFGRLRIGGKTARWQVVEPRGVLEVTDGVLHLCVMAMLGLQFQSVALTVSEEGVMAVGGEQRRLATGGQA